MQQDGTIRIKKPPENQGLLGKVRALFTRFSNWFAGAVAKARGEKGPGLGSPNANTLLTPRANGNATRLIKIKMPTAGGGGAGAADGVGSNGTVTQGGIVVAATDVPKCNACKEELHDGRPKARCSRNRQHVIHSDCVKFMRYKCPYCGGRISGYSRPAAGN